MIQELQIEACPSLCVKCCSAAMIAMLAAFLNAFLMKEQFVIDSFQNIWPLWFLAIGCKEIAAGMKLSIKFPLFHFLCF